MTSFAIPVTSSLTDPTDKSGLVRIGQDWSGLSGKVRIGQDDQGQVRKTVRDRSAEVRRGQDRS